MKKYVVPLLFLGITILMFYLFLPKNNYYKLTSYQTQYNVNLSLDKIYVGFKPSDIKYLLSFIIPNGNIITYFSLLSDQDYVWLGISNYLPIVPYNIEVSNYLPQKINGIFSGVVYYNPQFVTTTMYSNIVFYRPFVFAVTGVSMNSSSINYTSQCLYNASICGNSDNYQVMVSYSIGACSQSTKEPYPYDAAVARGFCSYSPYNMFIGDRAINGDPIGVEGRYVVSRPLIGLATPLSSLGLVVGVNNLFIFKEPSDPKSNFDNELNSSIDQEFYNYLGISKPSNYYNIPSIFVPFNYTNIDKVSLYVISSNTGVTTIKSGIYSVLHYVTDKSTWKSSIVTAPYVIPLFYRMLFNNINISSTTGASYSIYMPVMFLDDGKIIILDTAIVGYDVGNLTGYSYLNWVTGPAVGCNKISISNVNVSKISPYARVYYLTPSLNDYYLFNTGENISILVLDPYYARLQIINLYNVKVNRYDINEGGACRANLSVGGVKVLNYDLSTIGSYTDLKNLYIDPTYLSEGYLVLYKNDYYKGDLLTDDIYLLDINSGSISHFVYNDSFSFNFPALVSPNASLYTNILSSVEINGNGFPMLSIGEKASFEYEGTPSTYTNYYVYKPVFSTNIPKPKVSANMSYSYTLTIVPVNITYYSNGGSQVVNDVLVRINITNPQVLSSIATLDGRDIRIFLNDSYGKDYYKYKGLTYAIEKFTSNELVLLVLVPKLSSNSITTLYIYMGYPYAKYIAESPERLKLSYPLLNLK